MKETILGFVPNDWDIVKAKDFCCFVTDGTHDTPVPKEEGHYLVTSKNLKNNGLDFENCYFISKEDFININRRSGVSQYDVLYGMIGTIGNPTIIYQSEIDFAVKNVGLFKMGGDLGKSTWLYNFLNSHFYNNYISRMQSGTSQQFVGLGFLRKIPILVPKTKNNKIDWSRLSKINYCISSVDNAIQATKNSITKLEKLKTSLMQNLLTGKMKPDGSWRNEDEFYTDEKFGKVPIGWGGSNIGSFGELKTGKTPPTSDEKSFSLSRDIQFVTPGDVDNSVYIIDTERYVTSQGLKFSNSIPKNSVCFISIGSTIGKIAITTELCCTNQQINSIIPDEDNYYLFVYYQTMFNSPRIKSIAGVTATPQINKSDLSKFKLIKPNGYDEQKLIGVC